jgi:predicted short-subunit dehydrogenase-like oxidoreductase (DUF2520 family)
VSTHLQKALVKAGHEVCAVWSPTRGTTHDINELPQDADVYIIAVKDSALQEVIKQLTKRLTVDTPSLWRGKGEALLLHTAGSMPLSVFDGYSGNGGVLYPMQTFSMDREVDFKVIPLFIEGKDARIRQLAESISDHVYELSTADRKYLHLAAVFACNFANHCYTLAADVLEKKGLPFDVMLPLVDETARKVHELHPKEAQTGPAVRGDRNVMQAQAALLDGKAKDIYELLSQSIEEH